MALLRKMTSCSPVSLNYWLFLTWLVTYIYITRPLQRYETMLFLLSAAKKKISNNVFLSMVSLNNLRLKYSHQFLSERNVWTSITFFFKLRLNARLLFIFWRSLPKPWVVRSFCLSEKSAKKVHLLRIYERTLVNCSWKWFSQIDKSLFDLCNACKVQYLTLNHCLFS